MGIIDEFWAYLTIAFSTFINYTLRMGVSLLIPTLYAYLVEPLSLEWICIIGIFIYCFIDMWYRIKSLVCEVHEEENEE